MADIKLDTLITELEYDIVGEETLEKAAAAATDLDKKNAQLAGSTDKLSVKQRKLAEEIQQTKEESSDLKRRQDALRNTIRDTGTSTKAQRDQLAQLDRQLKSNKTRTERLRDETARLGLAKRKAGEQSRALAANQRRLSKAVQQATRRIRNEETALGKFGKRVAAIVSGLAIRDFGRDIIGIFTEAARAITELVPAFTGVADTIGKTSKALGISSDELQRFRFAGERSGVSADNMDKALKTLTKGFEDARQKGTGPVADAFDEMNLKLADFDELGTGDKVKRLADELNKVEDPTRRSALAMTLFGSKNKEMAVLLAEGSAGITALGDRAEELGGVISASAVVGAERLADQFLDLETFSTGLKNSLAASLAPQIEALTAGMLEWVSNNQELIDQGLEVVVGALGSVFQVVGEVIAGLPIDSLIGLFSNLAQVVSILVEQLVSASQDTGGFGTALIELLTAVLGVAVALGELFTSFNELSEEMPQFPGILDLIFGALKLTIEIFTFFANLLADVLKLIKPVIDSLKDLAATVTRGLDPLNSLRSSLGFASASAIELTKNTTVLNAALDETGNSAMRAVSAIQALADKQQEARKAGAEKKETKGRAQARAAEGARVIRDKQNEIGKDLISGKTSMSRLTEISNDSDATEKQRAQARKLLESRRKKGASAASKEKQSFLTAQITKQIDEAAKQAGARAASRAVLAGETRTEVLNKIERERREEVSTRLTERFKETGELPPGLAADLTQIANLPNVEAVAGKLAPPVLTVNNFKTDVVVEAITATVQVEGGINGTPQQIADATAAAMRTVTFADLGRAIQNNLTNLR